MMGDGFYLILKDDGVDKFIDANSGKFFWSPSRKVEDFDEKNDRETFNIEHMTGNDIHRLN